MPGEPNNVTLLVNICLYNIVVNICLYNIVVNICLYNIVVNICLYNIIVEKRLNETSFFLAMY